MVIVFKKKPYETVLYNLVDFQNQVNISVLKILHYFITRYKDHDAI